MNTPDKQNVITRFVKWAEENKIIRKMCVLWVVWLITIVVLNTTDPVVIKDVNSAVASIVIAVIGMFSIVLNALIKGDSEG
ncbi:MAG: hypothetical protein Tp1111DCM1126091_116 [Prokaryotic dsDNA virus sp.]|mgnify:FL=1|nr:MAG: hypothetical protein Tp1111DCM1126091_116 [Prokaryotic dsDNA virus sp.]|tara:strand:- start:36065 stop:36307 length:243 start_codon:yes stop_codon:yes gene_type:complete